MIKIVIIAALAALAAQCTRAPAPAPTPNPDPVLVADAGEDPDAQSDAAPRSACALACAHLAALKCLAALPTPSGATCVQVCSNAQSGPAGTSLDPACVIKAATCAKATACP